MLSTISSISLTPYLYSFHTQLASDFFNSNVYLVHVLRSQREIIVNNIIIKVGRAQGL